MISRVENVRLNGLRVGPYSFVARPKGEKGPFTYKVLIETKILFYDEQEHEVSIEKASHQRQQITVICITPLPKEEYFSP